MQSVLSISPNNPLSPLGVHTDLRVFAAHGVYGYPVVTSLPVPLPDGSVYNQPADRSAVKHQIEAAFLDSSLSAIKINELSKSGLISEFSEAIRVGKTIKTVCSPDIPTYISKTDRNQLLDSFVLELLPLCSILVINRSTANLILDDVDQNLSANDICNELIALGANTVLLVGVDSDLESDQSTCMFMNAVGSESYPYISKSIESGNKSDTNILAAAICSNLALGKGINEAIDLGINYTRQVVISSTNPKLSENKSPIPNNHLLDVVVTDLLENDTLELSNRPEKIENLARYVNVGKVSDT